MVERGGYGGEGGLWWKGGGGCGGKRKFWIVDRDDHGVFLVEGRCCGWEMKVVEGRGL